MLNTLLTSKLESNAGCSLDVQATFIAGEDPSAAVTDDAIHSLYRQVNKFALVSREDVMCLVLTIYSVVFMNEVMYSHTHTKHSSVCI